MRARMKLITGNLRFLLKCWSLATKFLDFLELDMMNSKFSVHEWCRWATKVLNSAWKAPFHLHYYYQRSRVHHLAQISLYCTLVLFVLWELYIKGVLMAIKKKNSVSMRFKYSGWLVQVHLFLALGIKISLTGSH